MSFMYESMGKYLLMRFSAICS